MEKKQLISVVKPLIAAALLFGSSGGVAWGQSNISGSTGIANVYGAGESTTISGGTLHIYASGSPGNTSGGANIVIHSYNANGRYHDYTNTWTFHYTYNTSSALSCGDPRPSSISSGWSGPTANLSGTFCSATFNANGGGTTDPYTSNQFGGSDDGISLVQVRGTTVQSDGTWGSRDTPRLSGSGGGLAEYRRPTTIGLNGIVNLTDILIKDLSWYYRTYDLQQTAHGKHQCITNSGNYSCTYNSPNYSISAWRDFLQYEHMSHGWNTTNRLGTTLLDAGVLILNGAKVCVDNDITDQTATAQSPFSPSTTEGVLIWPETGNFVLRARHLNKISMAHKDNPGNLDHNNPYFTDAQFTGLSVQNSSGNMYLYKSDGTSFPFLNTANLPATGHGYTNIPDLYTSTQASILGLRGNYHQDNAFVHTTGASDADKHGVIEVGSTTTGQQRFKVYSGGVIKNYSTTDCHAVTCAGVNFSSGNVPTFIF